MPRSPRHLALAILAVLAAAAAAKEAPVQSLPATVVIEAELAEKSPMPKAEDLAVYKEGLSVYAWKVAKVVDGTLSAPRVLVSHWTVVANRPQQAAGLAVGARAVLRLRPYQDLEDGLKEVARSDALEGDVDAPRFHDVGQSLVDDLPKGRWNYGVELSKKMPIFWRLKDQLRIILLGDCAAGMGGRAELYGGEANGTTPVAYNLCQQRSCLAFNRMLVDDYLVHVPRLEWVLLSWNPRWVNAAWKTHGLKHGQFGKSVGALYDRDHGSAWKAATPGVISAEELGRDALLGKLWSAEPWGWLVPPRFDGIWTDPRGMMRDGAKLKGTFQFSDERWGLFTGLLDGLVRRKVKVLAFIPPYWPETATAEVKDKDGTTGPDYDDQVRRMREVEAKHPGRFFFYDLNRQGRHGLLGEDDFGDIDHPNKQGAAKLTAHLEQYRLALEAQAGKR